MLFPVINRFTITKRQIPYLLHELKKQNTCAILDFTNENKNQHVKNYLEIMDLISRYPKQHVAIKLSSLNIQNNFHVETYLQNIIENAIKKESKILIDAEQFAIQDKINTLSNQLMKEYNKNSVIVYKTYQMYRKDSASILENDLIQERDYLLGIKLVRGAYYNEDFYQNDILSNREVPFNENHLNNRQVLFKHIQETHDNYNNGLKLFQEKCKKNDVLMCATHNDTSIEIAKKIHQKKSCNIEFAHLMGMSDKTTKKLAQENYKVFKYIPYGNLIDTIPYLIRRLHENLPMISNILK